YRALRAAAIAVPSGPTSTAPIGQSPLASATLRLIERGLQMRAVGAAVVHSTLSFRVCWRGQHAQRARLKLSKRDQQPVRVITVVRDLAERVQLRPER